MAAETVLVVSESVVNGTSMNGILMGEVKNVNTTSEPQFCGSGLEHFQAGYKEVHGYLSLFVCIFGSVANSLNIAVLTRREMISPTNSILTGLAVADLLVMAEYVPYALHMYLLRRPRAQTYTYAWAVFVLFHSNFAQVCHTVSILLTVTLAVWRYLAVAHPQRGQIGMPCTLAVVGSAYVLGPLLCAPHYLAFEVAELSEGNATLHFVQMSRLSQAAGGLLSDVNFWVYGVVVKLTPCAALTVLSLRIVAALVETKRRRRQLTVSASSRQQDKERQTDRTTRMLLAVLLLFLVTELPQGVLGLLSGLLGQRFFAECYVPLGELMDALALLNSAVNFILYCSMSRQFRVTFCQLFRPRALDRWIPVQTTAHNGHTGAAATTTNNATQVTQL
ncbi:G-protein coupled receptor dmsr-1-like [Schistocerca cancellata]|uniref:G-protein coupled receptor dmsr-1-like n=1 Tax=Schistocerca cancellata TaxID=274614 RepID=UPI0021191972|nr:G-protein coupled receptor dmsr-1-like [Schistocerca cancellata]